MLAKSILFTGLLVSLSSVFVNAKNSDALDPDSTLNSDFDYLNSENRQDDPFFSQVLTKDKRDELVKVLLSDFKKFAPEDLIKDIVELTDGHTFGQNIDIFINIINSSKGNNLERPVCLKILEEAINKIDTGQIKQQKLKRLKTMSLKPNWITEEDLKLTNSPNLYFPTANERFKIVKEVLREHKKSASES